MSNQLKKIALILLLFFVSGCSYLTSSATNNFGNNLKNVLLNHNDPETVIKAIPAYLLLQEALLVDDPDNETLLMSTASLYSSYNTLLDESHDQKRKQRLSQKSFDLTLRGACVHKHNFCSINEKNFDDFTAIIDQSKLDDLDSLYGLGASWANWIQSNRSDWNAVAQLAQVKYLMNHVISVKEDYKNGEVYLYLAVMECIVPPALGGKADVAKHNFEKALQLSDNKNLMVHVLYAQHYARMTFERDLHDTLLNAVINTRVEQKGFTLGNTLAQQKAKELLQSADDYF